MKLILAALAIFTSINCFAQSSAEEVKNFISGRYSKEWIMNARSVTMGTDRVEACYDNAVKFYADNTMLFRDCLPVDSLKGNYFHDRSFTYEIKGMPAKWELHLTSKDDGAKLMYRIITRKTEDFQSITLREIVPEERTALTVDLIYKILLDD